ncbi:MAG: type III-B CRISPR-associated protein Cas10/Cmr2 [Promethearchaeota archaeon]
MAFLHDPPDKALILFHIGHNRKRDEIIKKLLNKDFNRDVEIADIIASTMQRIHIPKDFRLDKPQPCNNHICFKGRNKPYFKHLFSGKKFEFHKIVNFINTMGINKCVERYGFNLSILDEFKKDDRKQQYFYLWRFLPEKYLTGEFLPADTRIPDHNIWDHLDVTSAIYGCTEGNIDKLGLLALKIPAVQDFIKRSRKLSDLWSASHLFSALIFEGLKVLINKYGPDTIIFPYLRGNPLLDYSFFPNSNLKLDDSLIFANIPNVILSFVNIDDIKELKNKIKEKIILKWKDIGKKVREFLLKEYNIEIDNKIWEFQLENSFQIVLSDLKMLNYNSYLTFCKDAPIFPKDLLEIQENYLSLLESPEQQINIGHFYSLSYQILSHILIQNSRIWDALEINIKTNRKCIMCGRFSALLWRKAENIYLYWNGKRWESINIQDTLLKVNEALCSVCLIKRTYSNIFNEIYKIKPPKFNSVVKIAASEFLEKINKNKDLINLLEKDIELVYLNEWESEDKKLLTDSSQHIKKHLEELIKVEGEPNKYYATVFIDGDHIGELLMGKRFPRLELLFHDYFKDNLRNAQNDLFNPDNIFKLKRSLTPASHMEISRIMKDFSIFKVPEIVKNKKGLLVYSGGDDILAFLPIKNALSASYEIQKFFRKNYYKISNELFEKSVMGFGRDITMSAGIVFAHYKYPLYDVIEKLRQAEKKAKEKYGRNALCITFIKHSGEILEGGTRWKLIRIYKKIIKYITEEKISRNFIMDFMNLLGNFDINNPHDLVILISSIKWLINRRKISKNITSFQLKIFKLLVIFLINFHYFDKDLEISDIGRIIKILYDVS